MKKSPRSTIRFAAVLLFAATQAFPQQAQQAASQRYASALYLKVQPDKEAAYIENFKTGAGEKAMRAMMKANPNLTSYSLRRAFYSGYPLPEANFVSLSTMNGPPRDLDPAKRNEIYREATGMNYADYIQKLRSMSEVVGSTLSHVHDTTPDLQIAEGDVIVTRRLKTAEGKFNDLASLHRDIRLPMATERVKGGNLKGWVFSHLTFPSGASLPWDATESLVYRSLADAMPGPGSGAGPGGGGGIGGLPLFTKLFPNRSFVRYSDDLREFSKVVRTELYRVVAVIRP